MKIIVVADKQASTFINNEKNLGVKDNEYVLFGDLVKRSYDGNRIVWKDYRWVLLPTRLVAHNHQITRKFEVERLVKGLLNIEHFAVIVGCDPDIAESHLIPRLKDFFTDDKIHLLSSALEEGRSETLRLREYIQETLYPTTVEKGSEESGEDVSKSNHQGEPRHLRITLTNNSDPKSTPSVIDVLFNEGDHLELDFRYTNQETSWKSL